MPDQVRHDGLAATPYGSSTDRPDCPILGNLEGAAGS
jgi:hypothetical protein